MGSRVLFLSPAKRVLVVTACFQGLSASEDAARILKTGLETAPNGQFLQLCSETPLGSKWLQPSKAGNHCFLIGATVNEGMTAFVSAVNGCGRWGLSSYSEKVPPDSCVVHLTNTNKIKRFFLQLWAYWGIMRYAIGRMGLRNHVFHLERTRTARA